MSKNSPNTTEDSAAMDSVGPGKVLLCAVSTALCCGVLFGLGDALVADAQLDPPRGLMGYLGCYSAAVMSYSAFFAAWLLPLSLLLMPLVRRKPQARVMALGLAGGLFAEIYWWTRPYVFEGHSSVSPERLGALGVQILVALGLAALLSRLLCKMPRGGHVALRLTAIFGILFGAYFVRSEQNVVANRGALNDRNRELPNVLLIIVDALRADHLACYGNERVSTPHIDALAKRGVLFENCYAQAPYTLTSFGSILTGKYPRRHGLVAQKPGVQMKPNVTLPLHLKSAKMQGSDDRLQDDDYATATFMTGAVSHGSGLARGFDAYSEAMMGHGLVETDSQWSTFRSELLMWLFHNKLTQRVNSNVVVSTARDWLQKRQGRRWMAMVHLYSTHTPYDPPAHFKEPYLDHSYEGPFENFYADHRYAIEAGEYETTDGDVQRIRDLYVAGAAQADADIGELLQELEALGMSEDTLVIVTSDHGEDLGEMRRLGSEAKGKDVRIWEHNHMWQTNLRVPMIMANTKLLPHGKRIEDLVETVDLIPTLCDLMGLELPLEDGVLEVDGNSLVPRMLGVQVGEVSTYKPKRYSFSENNIFLSIQDVRGKLIVPRMMVKNDDAEILFADVDWVRYFDLLRSPEESNNSLMENREHVLELWQALQEYDASMPEPEYVTTDRDKEQMRLLLEKLGYAGGIEYGVEPVTGESPKASNDPNDSEEE